MIALLPMFLFTGVELNMWLNWFPRQMHNTEIGLVMPAIAVAELIGGLVPTPLIHLSADRPCLQNPSEMTGFYHMIRMMICQQPPGLSQQHLLAGVSYRLWGS